MIDFGMGFVAALFFAAAFPGPSATIRAGVTALVRKARAKLGL